MPKKKEVDVHRIIHFKYLVVFDWRNSPASYRLFTDILYAQKYIRGMIRDMSGEDYVITFEIQQNGEANTEIKYLSGSVAELRGEKVS